MDDKAIVYIVDDDEAVRDGIEDLVQTMGMESQGFASAEDYQKAQKPDRPSCLLLDIRMPEMTGMELLTRLAAEGNGIPTIMVSGHGDISLAVEAMKTGATDFIEKPFKEQDLWIRIKKALKEWEDLSQTRAHRAEVQDKLAHLNAKEREVLRLLIVGETDKQIAIRLGVGRRAIAFHRTNILDKMAAANVVELTSWLARLDISI